MFNSIRDLINLVEAQSRHILYHTTERTEVQDIIQNGFRGHYASLGEGIYFYGSIESARTFARNRSYRSFKDPVILAIEDDRPEKVTSYDIGAGQDYRVYADVWFLFLEEDSDERFIPRKIWIADAAPRARRKTP
jgi:hypothetical protein